MKIIFLTHFYPKSRLSYYESRSRVGLAFAADAHQYAIAMGINEYARDMEIVNVPALYYFPFRFKDLRHRGEYIEENGLRIINVPFNLLMEYTFISQYIHTRKILNSIIESTDETVCIIVYGIKQQLMHAAVDMKLRYPDKVKLCEIVPDLPEDVNPHGHLVTTLINGVRNIFNKPTQYYYKYFDRFVLLTKYMQEKIGCSDYQFLVSEGIYEERTSNRSIEKSASNLFTIFYSGSLNEKFGIMNLVEAFMMLEDNNVRLQLCGYGDCLEKIKNLAKEDCRINYLGILSRIEVLALQSQASLLVNPRIPDNNLYTKYSFPSKTMEYFGSGTPSLIYRLDGIPEEYYKYCYSLDKFHTDKESLASMIKEIMNVPIAERLKLAADARNFILTKKNYKIVGKQIFNFVTEDN